MVQSCRPCPDSSGLRRHGTAACDLLEVIDQGSDFRHLVFGKEIASRHDVEMTRKLVSQWREPVRVAELDTYRRVTRDACPYLVRQSAADRLFANHWLLLPLSSDGSKVDHILTHLRMLPGDQEETGTHYHPITLGPAA